MRMLLKVSMPSETAKIDTIQQTLQSTMAALKPEAAYFYPEDGKRTAIFVFDMAGSWQIPAAVEPMFSKLGASVSLTPVMNAEDLQRGLKEAGA